jgi:hypothetical protein
MQRIKQTVGKRGKNTPDDTTVVQGLLKKLGYKLGKTGPKKDGVDGDCGDSTVDAIMAYQKKIGFKKTDGLIEPGGRTWTALAGGAKDEKTADATDSKTKSGAKKDEEAKKKSGGKGSGKVTGKTAKVGDDIIKVLEAVADHYNTTIDITSGWRSPEGQASAMWGGWDKHLAKNGKNGGIYSLLQKDEKLRADMDKHYQNADKNKFSALVVKNAAGLSLHLTGRAVDVSLKTAKPHIREALQIAGLRELKETETNKTSGEKIVKCWHYDSAGKVSAPSDATKKKFPAAK